MKNQKLQQMDEVLREDLLKPEEKFLLKYIKDFDRQKSKRYDEYLQEDFDLTFSNE